VVRIARLEGRYPSIARYYSISVEKDDKGKATSVTWAVEMPDEEVFGTYFLRTIVKTLDGKGGVREIEYLMEGTRHGTTTISYAR